MKKNQYNHIAFVYDHLSLVLGKSYRESKNAFLEELKDGDKVLFLGGGTGKNLTSILPRIGETGKVFFVEASSRMIEKAMEKVPSIFHSRIVFLHQSKFSAIPGEIFDFVLTQYFLDILPDKEIHQLFESVNLRSHKNTKWIFVDFFETKGKRWLLNLMVYFFRIITRNPRKDLPVFDRYFGQYGWNISQKKIFDQDFIQAWLLRKQ